MTACRVGFVDVTCDNGDDPRGVSRTTGGLTRHLFDQEKG